MTKVFSLRNMACLAALSLGSMAHADVTATDVWNDWKEQFLLYGEDNVTIGSEIVDGSRLTVSDIGLIFRDDVSEFRMSMDALVFEELGNGTVRVTMDDSYPMVIIDDVENVTVTIDVSQTGMDMIVSGEPEAMNYALTADTYEIALREVVSGDVTITGDAKMTANGIDLAYESVLGDLRTISYDGGVDSIDILVDFQVPGAAGEYVTFGGQIGGMQMQAEVDLPLDADFENPDNLFVDGFALAGGYVVEGAEYVFDINADGSQASGSAQNGQTTLTFEMSNNRFGYDVNAETVALNMLTSDFPLPIEVSLAQYGFGFSLPTSATDEPQGFNLGFSLTELSISDGLWDIFDAARILPRDPATFQIAISGQARALFDLFSPEAQQQALGGGDIPFELTSAQIDTLNIEAAGASAVGEGAFVFDPTDMQTFAPMPRPEGKASVEISGINGLLDNLVSMGLVPEDQVMGARMMMGMFARTTGDDVMESEVEVLPNGQVNVNGNRIR